MPSVSSATSADCPDPCALCPVPCALLRYLDGVKRRGRVRRVAKWAGLVVCLLLAAAWCMSLRLTFGYGGVLSGTHTCQVVSGGLLLCRWDPPMEASRWEFEAHGSPKVQWWPGWESFSLGRAAVSWFMLPLWMPFALVGIPTAWLWWRDWGRARPGHCSCGYDLAGLAPGAACPECGKGADRQRAEGQMAEGTG